MGSSHKSWGHNNIHYVCDICSFSYNPVYTKSSMFYYQVACRGSLQVCLHLSGTKLLINGALEEAVWPKKKNGVLDWPPFESA